MNTGTDLITFMLLLALILFSVNVFFLEIYPIIIKNDKNNKKYEKNKNDNKTRIYKNSILKH